MALQEVPIQLVEFDEFGVGALVRDRDKELMQFLVLFKLDGEEAHIVEGA